MPWLTIHVNMFICYLGQICSAFNMNKWTVMLPGLPECIILISIEAVWRSHRLDFWKAVGLSHPLWFLQFYKITIIFILTIWGAGSYLLFPRVRKLTCKPLKLDTVKDNCLVNNGAGVGQGRRDRGLLMKVIECDGGKGGWPVILLFFSL